MAHNDFYIQSGENALRVKLNYLTSIRGYTHRYYVFRDLSGNPISKAEARAIIQATWGDVSYPKKMLAMA